MANPLYDELFGRHAGKATAFLHLEDGTTLTHASFLALAAQYANALTATGVRPGDRLAAQVEKSPQALALYAACVQAGVVFLPLNTAYTVDELSYFIENSGATLVICDARSEPELTPVATAFGAQILTLN
ncbi:MAG: AMP-binding protein, partial [Rhodobacteraceae bacterium]|nr:AMP-binding protein [Paracoccaceae bacterium]